MRRYDAVVVGCGAMGSSTSYSLASKGLKVLTLERYGLNHDKGSSHGRSRIIRLAYYEDPRYVPLLKRAYASWREMEKKSGRRLLTTTGGLMVGPGGGELVKGVLNSVRTHGLKHSLLTGREAGERFPAFRIGEEMDAVYEEDAGVLYPGECIDAFVAEAKSMGAEFEFSKEVTRWRSTGEGIELEAGGEEYIAERLVLCAGPWTGKLLGGSVPLICERQVPMWFSSGGKEEFLPHRFPVFIAEESPGVFFYGIPELGHGVKVARTHGGMTVDPDKVPREVTAEDVEPVAEFISRRLPHLGRTPVDATTCIYTNTPDLNFAIGRHPADGRVTVVSACSGHGFKFASAMGEIAADLATGRKPAFDLSFLGVDRFGSDVRAESSAVAPG